MSIILISLNLTFGQIKNGRKALSYVKTCFEIRKSVPPFLIWPDVRLFIITKSLLESLMIFFDNLITMKYLYKASGRQIIIYEITWKCIQRNLAILILKHGMKSVPFSMRVQTIGKSCTATSTLRKKIPPGITWLSKKQVNERLVPKLEIECMQ